MKCFGNYTFIYPYVVLTNDLFPPSNDLKGGTIGDYSVIGSHSVILSYIIIGENCLVSANSVVKNNIPDYTLVMGDPAKPVIDVRKFVILGKGKLYPWMYRFSSGMPWEKTGFENWINKSDDKI